MEILVINPNTSIEVTSTIDIAARKYAAPGTEITTTRLPDGPDFIDGPYHIAIQTPKIVSLIEHNKFIYDYFIIACGFDLGLEACRTITGSVIGMGEAAIMTACTVAKRFSFLTVTAGAPQSILERLRSLGIDQSRCSSIRVVGSGINNEVVRMRKEMINTYYEVGKKCLTQDGAGALILNCAGMSDLKEYLEENLNVPVIAGVVSAVKIAEQFCFQKQDKK